MITERISTVLAVVLLAVLLGGCGDGTEPMQGEAAKAFGMPEAVRMEVPETLAQPEQNTGEIQLLLFTGSMTEQEEAAVQDELLTLHRNLQAPEYMGEALHMVGSEEWTDTLSVGLYEGCRSFTLQQGGQTLLTVQIGCDIDGALYVNVCQQSADGKLTLLKQTESRVSLLQTTVSEGKYDGAFECWQLDTAKGEIRREEGIYAAGVRVGDCSVSVGQSAAETALDLWNGRENVVYETGSVTYDEQGQIVDSKQPVTTEEPAATQKPATTPKPAATQKPATTPKPAVTPTPVPTQPPAQPEEDDDNNDADDNDDADDGDDGGSSSGDEDASSGGDAGDNGSDSAPSEGDTDIEWSPDLM